MSQQTFAVGSMPRVIMTRVNGDLIVHSWDQQIVQVEINGRVGSIQQEGDTLTIIDCNSDLALMVPTDASIKVSSVDGDSKISGVRHIELKKAGGDVELAEVEQAELEAVGGDFDVHSAITVVVSTIGGDLTAQNISTALRCGKVGGDCEAQDSADAEVTIGNIAGDLEIGGASLVQVGNVRGDCNVRNVQSYVEIGNISGDMKCQHVGGSLRIGQVGGDAELSDIGDSIEISAVGGDLDLQATFAPDSRTQIKVGGDATVTLPENPNLSISVMTGGEISGAGIVSTAAGNMMNLTYGNGVAHLNLQVGGDLALRSFDNPRSSSSMGGSWNDFGREMANFGREMGKLGQDLSREIAESLKNAGMSKGADFADDIARKVEKQVRRAGQRAEEEARRAEEKAHRAGEEAYRAEKSSRHSTRVNVRFNDREWRMNPERLEHIKAQASKAANEGISGALEAVERALSNIRKPNPPVPPMPPVVSMQEEGQPASTTDATGTTNTIGETASPEQEREAILRMIAEGRITPEEGDMLLEALGE